MPPKISSAEWEVMNAIWAGARLVAVESEQAAASASAASDPIATFRDPERGVPNGAM